jgi:hypothetical protein
MTPDHDGWVLVEVPRPVGALWDAGVRAAVVLAAIALGGFAILALGWRGVAAQNFVPNQVPFLISAGFGGTALVATGGVVLRVHLGRRAAAARRAMIEDVIRAAGNVTDSLTHRGGR